MQRRTMLAGGAALAAVAMLRAAAAAPERPVLVFAAASLKNALDAIAAKWQGETGGRATISYAASSLLAKQIENGAPADLFISADLQWMDYLQQRKLIDPKSRVDLLGNRLVLIAAKDSALAVTIAPGFALARLLGDGRLAMADPAAVPAGIYGKAALEKLRVWPAVAGRVAAAENVRAALALVARGEAPLGIVYQTDAAVEPGVRIVAAFPPDSVPPIVYPMALTPAAPKDAAAFALYLRGPLARALFEAQGFSVIDRPA
ncbi:MAG TPA: molybdate ABC transporter substrate-binding protein [Stellaceae bacterium]|nr:molybdate ABC transporter substrate-binding protein [Stellaceae bacterium]